MAHKLLDHVRTITLHRDTALLDRSVIASLLELLHLDDVKLVEIYRLDGELYFTTTAWSEEREVFGQDQLPPDAEALPLAAYAGAREAVESNEIVSVDEAGQYRHWIPVHSEDGPIACFELRHQSGLTSHQLDLAAGIIGLYRNYRALLEDSQQDTLTGLSNRKTFDHSLAHFLSSASEKQQASPERRHGDMHDHWLAVIDIDHFKRVNDRFGHLYGDEVLILVANRMRRCFRQDDKLFRFGGEEFVVLLRHVDAAGAHSTLDRFRMAIAGEEFPQVGQVTVSIGFARAEAGASPAAVLGNADEALYFAKGNGRNQVCQYEALVAAGNLERKTLHTEAEFF